MLLMRATRLQRRHRAFLGTLALAQARARPNILVSPADGQRVVALDGTASVTLHLSTRRRVCVAATLPTVMPFLPLRQEYWRWKRAILN